MKLMVSTKTNTIKLSLAVILFISLTSFAQTSTIVFHLPERSGYQSDFSFFDESRNEYVRSWSLRNSGTYIETYDVGTGQLKRVEYFDEIPFIHSFIKISEGEYITYDANDRVYYTIKESKVTGQVSEPVNSMILGAFEKYVTSMQFNPIFLYQDKVAHVNSFLRLYKPYHVDNRHQEEGLIQLTDLKNKSVTDLLPLPKVLDSMDFGELNRFSSVIKGKQLIIAPSYSNEIIIVDLKSLNYIYPIVTKNEFYQITTPYENMRKRQAD